MNIMTINGKVYHTNGKNISVIGDKILVNGEVVEEGLSGIIEVKFMGELGNLTAHNATVSGNVFGDAKSHNIICTNINGDVEAHNVKCETIKGNVNAKNVSYAK